MANSKLSDLVSLGTAPDSSDLLYIVDSSDTSQSSAGTSKQITFAVATSNLATSGANSNITSLTGLTTPLSVSQGGLGVATVTGILLGAGTSGVTGLSSSGTGNVVRVAGATLTTPTLGVATATSLNGLTLTSSTGVITITNAKTLTVSDSTTLATNSITLAGGEVITFSATNALSLLTTGTSVMTFPTTTDTVVTLAATQTLTAKRITQRISTVADAATITPTADSADQYNVTALAQAATIAIPSGTPTNGQKLVLRFLDNGTARALTWTTSAGGYRVIGVTLPTTTVLSKTLYVGCIYNSADSFWDVVAVQQAA